MNYSINDGAMIHQEMDVIFPLSTIQGAIIKA